MLTPKKCLFADEYIIDFNATQAAKRAGYCVKTAYSQGQRLLKDVEIQALLQKALEKRAERTEITQDRVLEEYAKLAFLDPQKFYDADGNLLAIPDLPKDVAAALSGMDVIISFNKKSESSETIKKIKFSDKKAALDSVAKHLGMFEKHQNQGAATIVINSTDIKKPKNAGTGKG